MTRHPSSRYGLSALGGDFCGATKDAGEGAGALLGTGHFLNTDDSPAFRPRFDGIT